MPNTIAPPDEADALRRLAGATKHVHLPATWVRFLLALLALLTGSKALAARIGADAAPAHGRTWRTPLRDWHFSPTGETIEDLAPAFPPAALRRLRRLRQQRAWLGWILRCLPGLGMRRSGKRAPAPRPVCTARAPPRAPARPMSP